MAKKVQGIVGQGKGKRPEAQVQTATGGSEFVRLEEALPRPEVESAVRNQQQAELQQQVAQAQVQLPQQLTPNLPLNADLQQGGTQVPSQPQNAAIGQGNGLVSDSAQQQPLDTRTAFEQAVNFPRAPGETVSPKAVTAQAALGLTGGAAFLKAAAKQALNTPAATSFINKFISPTKGIIIRGGAPKVGEVAVNTKSTQLTSQLISSIWVKLGATAGAISFLSRLFDNGLDDRRYISALGAIDNEIIKNNDDLGKETVPQVRQAYMEEQAILLALRDDVTNPTGWETLINYPIINKKAVNSISARATLAVSDTQIRRARIALSKYALEQSTADVIRNLPPDVREAFIEQARLNRESESTAKSLIEGGA